MTERRSLHGSAPLLSRAVHALRPRRLRLYERDFWWVQILVLAATVSVYGFDHFMPGWLGQRSLIENGLHDIPVMLYLVPVLYAALVYGFEGAMLTSVWCALLATPHMATATRDEFEWLGEAGTLTTILVAGVLLAARTERERESRQRAEAVSAQLRILNDLERAYARMPETGALLQELVTRLREGLLLDAVWVRYEATDPPLFASAGSHGIDGELELQRLGERASPIAAELDGASESADGWLLVPLVAERQFMGVLGAARLGERVAVGARDVIVTATAGACVALMNQRLQLERRESLRRYAQRVTDIQEEERHRIARELHDGVTQTLSGLVRGFDFLRHETSDPDSVDTLERMRSVAAGSIADIRRVSRDLLPATLDDLGLLPAIRSIADDMRQRTGITTRLETYGRPLELPRDQQLCIFRIVQEALSNIEKHSDAASARISVAFGDDAAIVRVQDDGRGFALANSSDLLRSGSFGIFGMQQRAELQGGTLRVDPSARGTTLTLTLPLEADGLADAGDDDTQPDVDGPVGISSVTNDGVHAPFRLAEIAVDTAGSEAAAEAAGDRDDAPAHEEHSGRTLAR